MGLSRVRLAALAAAFASFAMLATGADARDWVVVGMKKIPVREYPSAAAPVVETIPGGAYINLTGKCTRDLDLNQISYMHALRQRWLVKSRWCELGGSPHGWVFGGFMKPF
jgi:uncharacterized protein YraI